MRNKKQIHLVHLENIIDRNWWGSQSFPFFYFWL